jgi:prefoldin subunit 5
MMEFLKKYYKKILTVLAVILLLSMCTRNCSNKNEIRQIKQTYAASDSIMTVLNDSIKTLNIKNDNLQTVLNNLETISQIKDKQINDLNNALNRKVIVNIKSDKNE